MKKYLTAACLISINFLFVACSPRPSGETQPALKANESFQVLDNYEMHYNAVRTDQLTADVARAYGIERSKNKVLLNISVLAKTANGSTTSSDADITVLGRNLNGQVKNVLLRRIAESTAIYYIAEVDFSGSETLVFEIKAIPAGSNSPITATLTREFFAD